jgi:hypothetical protein
VAASRICETYLLKTLLMLDHSQFIEYFEHDDRCEETIKVKENGDPRYATPNGVADQRFQPDENSARHMLMLFEHDDPSFCAKCDLPIMERSGRPEMTERARLRDVAGGSGKASRSAYRTPWLRR